MEKSDIVSSNTKMEVDKMRILIIWGGWIGHNPEKTAQILKSKLVKKGFEVKSTCDFSIILNENLEQYDVIVPIWSCGIKGNHYLDVLLDAIRNGVGFATFHGGINWFEEDKYYEMIGGFYLNDAPFDEFQICIKNNYHPITKDVNDFRSSGEIYNMQFDPSNNILATIQTQDFTRPYAWTKNYGKGKVFYSMGAHDLVNLCDESCLDIITNGITWCGKK